MYVRLSKIPPKRNQERHGREITDTEAREEIVARACEDLFGRSEALQKFLADFAEKNKKAANKFMAAVKKILDNIKNFFGELLHGVNSKTAEAKIINRCGPDALKALQAQFDKTFLAAIEGNAARNALGEHEQGGELYSSETAEERFQREYEANVDAVLNGTYGSEDVLIMGRTPKSLVQIGMNQLPLTITAAHVYSIAKTEAEAKAEGRYHKNEHYHGLGANAVKQIRSKLSTPIMVIAHQEFTKDQKVKHLLSHRVIALVDFRVDGKQVICPIEVDGEIYHGGIRIDTNVAVTYFDKNQIDKLIKEAVARENVGEVGFYYIDAKRANAFLQDPGHQLPQQLASRTSAHNIIINPIWENVNRKISHFTQSQQFTRWFGDWQNKPATASKVVGKDGSPLIVYHGTNADFSVFQKNNRRTRGNLNFGEGYYFTSSRNMAENYADGENGRVVEAYIAIRNPYTVYWSAFDQYDFESIAKMLGDGTVVTSKNVTECLQRLGFDGIIERSNNGADNPIRTVVAFESAQIKSATDNIGTFDGNNPDTLYSDPADDEKSDRELLASALMSAAQNEVERNALAVYQRRAKKLDAMSKRLVEVNAEIRSMMFQRGARDEAYTQKLDALKAEKDKLERSIAQSDSKLLTLEATKSLQALLERERQRTAKLWIEAGRKRMNNYRERNLVRMYSDKIEDKGSTMS